MYRWNICWTMDDTVGIDCGRSRWDYTIMHYRCGDAWWYEIELWRDDPGDFDVIWCGCTDSLDASERAAWQFIDEGMSAVTR